MFAIWFLLPLLWVVRDNGVLASPLANARGNGIARIPRDPQPGFEMSRTPDGGVTGSFSAAEGVDIPGVVDAGMSVGNTFTAGPSGVSFSNSNSQSFNSPLAGISSSFSNADAMSAGPGGFGASNANAYAMSNPLFQSSYANANSNSFNNPMNSFRPNFSPPGRPNFNNNSFRPQQSRGPFFK